MLPADSGDGSGITPELRRLIHELRQPLNIVSLSAGNLRAQLGGALAGAQADYFHARLDRISEQIDRASRLLDSVSELLQSRG